MLGDLLRETREQKNLSLEDIEKGTNIRKLYIKAIEEGDYGKLPGEVFLKGFIKTYGKFLGLDGQKLIDQYKAEKAGIKPEPAQTTETVADKQENKQEASTETVDEKKDDINSTVKEVIADKDKQEPEETTSHTPKIDDFDSNKQYLETQSSGKKKNVFIIIVIIIVIIGGAIAYISSQSSSQAPAASQEQTSSQEAQPAQQPQPQQQQPAPQTGSNVAATFSQDCWVEVKVDGKVVLSETVKAGTQLNWQGQQQVDITAGNAGAVDVTFNGQPAGKLGEVGQVVTKSFPAPNAQQAQQQPAQQAQQAQPQQQQQPAQNQAK